MKLLITGAWVNAKNHLSELQSLGHEVVFMQNESENLPCDPLWVEGVICNGLFLSHDISAFQNLKYIQLTSAGYDRVPMEYVTAHNITIHNARGVYSIPMAEYALCGVLALYKQSRFFLKNQMQHKWEKHRGLIELHGKTVCIVGCGSVGTECAKRFSAFGTVVRGIDLLPRKCDAPRQASSRGGSFRVRAKPHPAIALTRSRSCRGARPPPLAAPCRLPQGGEAPRRCRFAVPFG